MKYNCKEDLNYKGYVKGLTEQVWTKDYTKHVESLDSMKKDIGYYVRAERGNLEYLYYIANDWQVPIIVIKKVIKENDLSKPEKNW